MVTWYWSANTLQLQGCSISKKYTENQGSTSLLIYYTIRRKPRHPRIFCRLQSNLFNAASLLQTNLVVHWNAPRERIVTHAIYLYMSSNPFMSVVQHLFNHLTIPHFAWWLKSPSELNKTKHKLVICTHCRSIFVKDHAQLAIFIFLSPMFAM